MRSRTPRGGRVGDSTRMNGGRWRTSRGPGPEPARTWAGDRSPTGRPPQGGPGEPRYVYVAHEVEAATAAAGEAPDSALPAPADLFGSARILIVDDRDSNVLLLETILRAEGVVAIESLTDSRHVVDRCLAFRPDVLLLDLHMPHMDGFAVMRELRGRLAPDVFLPVIVLTADATSDSRLRTLEAGAKDFLTKPIDRVEVVLRVRNLLETGALVRGREATARAGAAGARRARGRRSSPRRTRRPARGALRARARRRRPDHRVPTDRRADDRRGDRGRSARAVRARAASHTRQVVRGGQDAGPRRALRARGRRARAGSHRGREATGSSR